MDEVIVDLGPRSYPIFIGRDLLGRSGQLLQGRTESRKILLVTNPVVGDLYQARLCRGLREAGFEVSSTRVPDGEEHKTLSWAARLYEVLFAQDLDRGDTVMALGGGVVGDLAGFVAATFKRGLHLIQVPTTLLAQVDAAVGGKVGVDHPKGKNMIGAFHQPDAVLADLEVLRTLDEREIRAGLAEVIKYGVIADGLFFHFIESQMEQLLRCDLDAMGTVVKRSCEIKAAVVAADERDRGERAVLNFGHTLGHAIEAATGYRTYRHGEAVAMGMAIAAEIAVRMGLAEEETFRRLVTLLRAARLSTEDRSADPEAVMDFMRRDKKSIAGRLRFILPRTIGGVEIFDEVPEELILDILKEHRQ
jgi:3-dehydroquinate synthase